MLISHSKIDGFGGFGVVVRVAKFLLSVIFFPLYVTMVISGTKDVRSQKENLTMTFVLGVSWLCYSLMFGLIFTGAIGSFWPCLTAGALLLLSLLFCASAVCFDTRTRFPVR